MDESEMLEMQRELQRRNDRVFAYWCGGVVAGAIMAETFRLTAHLIWRVFA